MFSLSFSFLGILSFWGWLWQDQGNFCFILKECPVLAEEWDPGRSIMEETHKHFSEYETQTQHLQTVQQQEIQIEDVLPKQKWKNFFSNDLVPVFAT